MNKSLLLITASFVVFALSGCGGGGGGNVLSGYAVDELADKAVANEEAYMGKEVVVSGYASWPSPNINSNGYSLKLDFDRHSPIERMVSCIVPQGKAPEGIDSKWVTVKGKIANIHSQNYMDLKSIELEPCELVK